MMMLNGESKPLTKKDIMDAIRCQNGFLALLFILILFVILLATIGTSQTTIKEIKKGYEQPCQIKE